MRVSDKMNEERSILGIISEASKEVNPESLDNILATISKYERLMDKFIAIYNRLDRSGVIPAVLRIIGKKADIEVDKPISNPLNIVAKSATHKALFEILNELDEGDIRAIHEQIIISKAMMEMDKNANKGKNDRDTGTERRGENMDNPSIH